MKTEPDVFSFSDLIRRKDSTEGWDGVRNYQARNFMRDEFRVGDQVLVYHSRIIDPAVVGIAEVVREAYADDSALDKKSKYFDIKSFEKGISRWVMIDIKAKAKLKRQVTLREIRKTKALAKMLLVQKGQRLSIQPLKKSEWDTLLKMGSPEGLVP